MQRAIPTTQAKRYSSLKYIVNDATGEAVEFIKTAADTNGAYAEFYMTAPPGFDGPPRHAHTLQEENFRVVSGKLGIEIDGKKQVLQPGDELTVPAGKPHVWWVEGSKPVKGWGRISPALHFAEFLDAISRSANEHRSEMPALIDAAIILRRYRKEQESVFLPLPIRLFVLPILALIGRLTGRAKVIDQWITNHYQ